MLRTVTEKKNKLNGNYNYLLLTETRRTDIASRWYRVEITDKIADSILSVVTSKSFCWL
jgi:KaiC/GvpD/RAD55 family RecA-like ATPase